MKWTFLSRGPEHSPLALSQEDGTLRRRFAFLASSLIHAAVILLMIAPLFLAPVFVKPNLLARGEGGTSTPTAVALYLPQDLRAAELRQSSRLTLPAGPRQKQKIKTKRRHNVLDEEKKTDSVELGSQIGATPDGSAYGDEVKPALPVSFAEPRISRWELPRGLQGDVVIEVTIDALGNVVEEKLLQGLGQGIDEKVLAAVRDWRFRPATRNGVAIPSKHDVHFHFPS
jgi:TonB family protein